MSCRTGVLRGRRPLRGGYTGLGRMSRMGPRDARRKFLTPTIGRPPKGVYASRSDRPPRRRPVRQDTVFPIFTQKREKPRRPSPVRFRFLTREPAGPNACANRKTESTARTTGRRVSTERFLPRDRPFSAQATSAPGKSPSAGRARRRTGDAPSSTGRPSWPPSRPAYIPAARCAG